MGLVELGFPGTGLRRGPAPCASLKRRRPAGQYRDHAGVSFTQPWSDTAAGGVGSYETCSTVPPSKLSRRWSRRHENEEVSLMRSTGRLLGGSDARRIGEQGPVAPSSLALSILPLMRLTNGRTGLAAMSKFLGGCSSGSARRPKPEVMLIRLSGRRTDVVSVQ